LPVLLPPLLPQPINVPRAMTVAHCANLTVENVFFILAALNTLFRAAPSRTK
jgi:hypothetical protein